MSVKLMKHFRLLTILLIAMFCLGILGSVFTVGAVATTSVTVSSQLHGHAVWYDNTPPIPSQGGEGTFNFAQGHTIMFDAIPDNNYRFAGFFVYVGNINVGQSFSDPVSFQITSASFTIQAHFELSSVTTFKITVSQDINTFITPGGISIVNSGDGLTEYYSSAIGYQVSSVIVDGYTQPITGFITFTNVLSDHAVSIASTPIPVSNILITFVNTTGGSLSWTDLGQPPISPVNPTMGSNGIFGFPIGENLFLQAYPNSQAGYVFSNYTVTGGDWNSSVSTVNPQTFTVTSTTDYTVTAYFQLMPSTNYTVIVSSTSGGQLTWNDTTATITGSNGTFFFAVGDSVTFTASPYAFNYFQGMFDTYYLFGSALHMQTNTIVVNHDFNISAAFSNSNLNYSMRMTLSPTPLNYNLSSSTTSFILEQGKNYVATVYITSLFDPSVFGEYNLSSTPLSYDPLSVQNTGVEIQLQFPNWNDLTTQINPLYHVGGGYALALSNQVFGSGIIQLAMGSNGTGIDTLYQGISMSIFSQRDSNYFNSPIYTFQWLTTAQVTNQATPTPWVQMNSPPVITDWAASIFWSATAKLIYGLVVFVALPLTCAYILTLRRGNGAMQGMLVGLLMAGIVDVLAFSFSPLVLIISVIAALVLLFVRS